MAVTMKNSVFWDVLPCGSSLMSSLSIEENYVRFEVFTVVTVKNGVSGMLRQVTHTA
jgi:hypothetical protein